MRELLNRAYMGALIAYITVDIWLFHKASRLDNYLTRRGL